MSAVRVSAISGRGGDAGQGPAHLVIVDADDPVRRAPRRDEFLGGGRRPDQGEEALREDDLQPGDLFEEAVLQFGRDRDGADDGGAGEKAEDGRFAARADGVAHGSLDLAEDRGVHARVGVSISQLNNWM